MPSKNRYKVNVILIVIIVILVLLITASVLFPIFSKNDTETQHGFDIGYSATNVTAEISGQYVDKNGDGGTLKCGNDTIITFVPTNTTSVKYLSGDTVTLTVNNNYIIYSFTFKNKASIGGHNMLVSLSSTVLKENVTTKYLVSSEGDKGYDDITSTAIPSAYIINPQDYMIFYILIEIKDDSLDAKFVSTEQNGICWVLSSI